MDLVFIALVPPEPTRAELRAWMEHYSGLLGSQKALHLPPHITLTPPFLTKHYNELLKQLQAACATLQPFTVELEGLDHFGERVLFSPVRSEYIHKVHDTIIDITALYIEHRYRGHPRAKMSKRKRELLTVYGDTKVKEFYKPHLTLAKSDINTEKLRELLQNAQDVPICIYHVGNIAVLKHVGERWHVDAVLLLGA
jgi:2'-5' RNA ligase